MKIRTLAVACTVMIAGQSAVAAQPLQLSTNDLIQRQLMIFQSGQTLFSEHYQLPKPLQATRIDILGINPQFQPGSALTAGIGQVERIALLTRANGMQQQLESLVGTTLQLKRYTADGSAVYREAKLLGVEGNRLLLEEGERVEYLPLDSGWIPMLPTSNVSTASVPQLSIQRSGRSSDNLLLNYMGGGLSWRADYALTLNAQKGALALQAQATLSNHSGIDLSQSLVRLLAGRVNQPQAPRLYMAKAAMEMTADSTMAEQQAFEDYHLYTLPQPTDLPDGATVSVPLMPVQQLKYSNHYRFEMPVYGNAQPQPVNGRPQRVISFDLPKAKQGGTPLPSGSARVYVDDLKQGLSYIGGQQLQAHAAGEQVEMTLGEVFDVGIELIQSQYERQGNTTRLAYQVTLSNAGDKAKTIELSALFNQNWKILQSSLPADSQGAQARWRVDLPAEGKTTLSYRVELTRR